MLHRFEDVIITPLTMDLDIPLAKIILLRQYGFTSEELIRDPLNFFIKYSEHIPLNINSVGLNNLVSQLDPFTSSSLSPRWAAAYATVANKIPLTNFANTYYELWVLIINRYRMVMAQYFSKLKHILLCEGLPYPNIFIQDVIGNPGDDVLLSSSYITLRIFITQGE